MGTSDVSGRASRLDRWLDENFDGLLEKKQRLEAAYYRKRAEYAHSNGDLETAEEYYDRAVSLYGRLGEREIAADLGLELAHVARENGNLGVANKHFERVAELHSRRKNAIGALDAIEPRIEIAKQEDNDSALVEWWGNALMILGRAEDDVPAERRDELVSKYAEQIRSEDSAGRLYGFALNRFADGQDETGADLLDAVWDRRDVVREPLDVFRVVLAAGLARVAYAELNGRDVDREAAIELAEQHRDRLSDAADALFETLTEGETDADLDQLRTDLDTDEPLELREIEGEVFVRFIEDL